MKNKMPGFSLLPDQGRKYKVAGLDANIGFDAIDQLFPFFFVFDQSLKICLVGSSLKKLESSLAVGSLISERFVIVNPRVSMNFEQLLTHYIAQHNWLLDNSVTLRGQLLPILNDRFLIFLGSPWIQDTEQLSRLGLTFGDFAKHDSTLENLFIKQAQLTYAIDNQALRATMEQSIAELKKLEALHEELAFELNTTYDLKVRFLRRNIILDIHVPAYLSKKLNRLELIGKDIYQALPFLNTPLTDALQDNQEYSRPIPLTFEIEVKDRKYVFEARLIMTPSQEYLLLASDVTQEHYLQAQLEKRANYDSLTGLANRSYFFEQIERLKSVHSDRTRAVTAMIIDLDNFKLINDRYGHAAGDFVLKTVAKVLVEQTRDNDIATRLGGDEFGIYACNSASTQQMIEMAKRICTCIDQPIYFEGHSFRPSCSIGLAFSDRECHSMSCRLRQIWPCTMRKPRVRVVWLSTNLECMKIILNGNRCWKRCQTQLSLIRYLLRINPW